MKYFLKVTQTLSSKNKLEKAIYELFKELDHTLILDNKLDDFKALLTKSIEDINITHSRCKSVVIDFHKMDHNDSIYIAGLYNVVVKLYQVKKEF